MFVQKLREKKRDKVSQSSLTNSLKWNIWY